MKRLLLALLVANARGAGDLSDGAGLALLARPCRHSPLKPAPVPSSGRIRIYLSNPTTTDTTNPMDNPLFQWLNQHVWLDGCELETELLQAHDEGRNLSAVEGEFQRLLAVPRPADGRFGGNRNNSWLRDAQALMDHVQTLPQRAGYRYIEPSDRAGIRAVRPRIPALKPWRGSRAKFLQKLHGGLLGRMGGCMLGKPVEGWRRANIRAVAETIGHNWPLRDYWRLPNKVEVKKLAARDLRPFPDLQNPCVKPNLRYMVEDDDTNYTTIGFAVVQKKGPDFTPLDVASFWCENVPVMHTCTAERVAYRNFLSFIVPPASATFRNPYREWIGAQIRADYFGYANPGNPEHAADWAWRDASISHIKNGIYGEMWVAAMLATAYVETDWVKIIRAGLAQIPAQSRLTEDIEKILTLHANGASYDAAVEFVHQQWDEKKSHHWCHTNSNAQIVALALLWGENDFEKTITRAVMPGFDTDCNGATAGSVWGIVHGVNALPAKWTKPLHDRVQTGVAGYHDVKISQLATDMTDIALKNQ